MKSCKILEWQLRFIGSPRHVFWFEVPCVLFYNVYLSLLSMRYDTATWPMASCVRGVGGSPFWRKSVYAER